jgi:indole-3-glycerol phosphate synthase
VVGARRLSQAIAEGDGISVLAEVRDAAGARAAAEQGAEGLVVRGPVDGVREATPLPILLYPEEGAAGPEAEADAVVLAADREGDELRRLADEAAARGLECVVRVGEEEHLERALELLDPEVLLLAAGREDDRAEGHLERLLELLPDVPAGKLAIAELPGATPAAVGELERAGVDAVLVTASDVASLVGDAPPDV